jgi:hypothetical protein
VQPLRSLCLCGYGIVRYNNHRDTENAEIAQRRKNKCGRFLAFRVANSETICDASVRSASSGRGLRLVRATHDSRQSETQLRPPIMHKHQSHMHRDSLPNHRGKEDIRQGSNPLQHEFPAGARLLQVVQSIAQDLCKLPCSQRLSFQIYEHGPFSGSPCSSRTNTLMYARPN